MKQIKVNKDDVILLQLKESGSLDQINKMAEKFGEIKNSLGIKALIFDWNWDITVLSKDNTSL
ncbi:MAG: hypothetical protein AABY22_05400 [Nanoarchaeota archaeon]